MNQPLDHQQTVGERRFEEKYSTGLLEIAKTNIRVAALLAGYEGPQYTAEEVMVAIIYDLSIDLLASQDHIEDLEKQLKVYNEKYNKETS